jgi:hypothetical protein
VTDLDAAIRARLAEFTDDHLLIGEYGSTPGPGHAEMQAALLAVLDRHQLDPEWDGAPRCKTCLTDRTSYADMWTPDAWPCGELRGIAAALGVEADRD